MIEVSPEEKTRKGKSIEEKFVNIDGSQEAMHAAAKLKRRFLRTIDVLKLFIPTRVIETVCLNTNKHAWRMILEISSYT